MSISLQSTTGTGTGDGATAGRSSNSADAPLTAFQRYLRRIISSRDKAREVIKACEAEDDVSRATLTIVWNELFDRLLKGGREEDLVQVSSIVQKLYGSTNQRKALEIKTADFERKLEEWEEKKKQLKESMKIARSLSKGGGLSEETLREIEEELNLL